MQNKPLKRQGVEAVEFLGDNRGFSEARFVHPEGLFPEFNCLSCGCVMRRPVSVGCPTNHKMCQACCTEWFKQKRECPACRSPVTANAPTLDISLHGMIGRQIVFCANNQAGCEWQGKLEDAEEHEARACPCRTVSCSHPGCNFRCLARDLAQHANGCPRKRVPCQHCRSEFPQGELDTHFGTCPRIPIACPHGCGASVPRSEMPQHEAGCPNFPVACPVPTCTHRIPRHALDQHLADPSAAHMRAMAESLRATQAELQETKAQLAELMAAVGGRLGLDGLPPRLQQRLPSPPSQSPPRQRSRSPPASPWGLPPPPPVYTRLRVEAPVFHPSSPIGGVPDLRMGPSNVEHPYQMLLNSALCTIRDQVGYAHPSLDHFYFAQMAAEDPVRLAQVHAAPSALEAREAACGARSKQFNRQWAMRQGLVLKFLQHPELCVLLAGTHPRRIVFEAGQSYWGHSNRLGRLLMQLRDLIRSRRNIRLLLAPSSEDCE
ncbi:putative TNF receptor-associated factor 3 [Paratrimastix pyriformis]|uniref:TNF receptor-associated factor 3 n=1 Tax=Paratrimastix pyriformis TaxID=342808 RepID=A0ABQ8UBD9_9EUKA|nr:putative TNF receptor-associated factor 3 [Paratrimastix pyriformis]